MNRRGTSCSPCHLSVIMMPFYPSFRVSGTCRPCAGVSLNGVVMAFASHNTLLRGRMLQPAALWLQLRQVGWVAVIWVLQGRRALWSHGYVSIISFNKKQTFHQGLSFAQMRSPVNRWWELILHPFPLVLLPSHLPKWVVCVQKKKMSSEMYR